MLGNFLAMGYLAVGIVSFTFLVNIFLAGVVYRNNPRSWTNRLLSILSLIFASWAVFNFFALLPGDEAVRFFWVKMVMFISSFTGVVTYLLALSFPGEKIPLAKKYVVFSLVFALFVAIFSFSPLMFRSLHNIAGDGFNLNPGPFLALFGLEHIGFTTAGFVVLIRKLRSSRGRLKQQLYWFLWGIALTLSLVTVSNFFAIVFFDSVQYTFVGPVFTLFQASFIAYAVVKHRFLDIRLLVARSVAYSFLTITLGLIYVGGLFLISFFITKDVSSLNSVSLFSSAGLTLLVALSFQPLRHWFEKVTDKIFHQEHYNVESLLQSLSKSMATSVSFEDINRNVLKIIKENLKVTDVSLLMAHKHLFVEYDLKKRKTSPFTLSKKEFNFFKKKSLLVFDELPESKVKNILREHQIFAIVPLRTSKHFIGFLILGEKESGNTFFAYDVRLLSIIGPELAVALQNAQRFEEIREFNTTLQDRVKRATVRLRGVNSRLKELDDLKDEFLSVAAHQLRTPLGSIRWNLESILGGDFGKLNKQTREIVSESYDGVRRLIRLINNLLNVSRIEQKRIKDDPERVNLVKIIKDTISEMRGLIQEKKLEITLNVRSGSKIPLVKIDPRRFREIVLNLLSNAIKYSNVGGDIKVDVYLRNKKIIIDFSDHGIGIPQEDQPGIFDKFFRADNANKSKEQGSGLGLFVVKSYIEGWGGGVSFRSKENEGTTFSVVLPFKPSLHVLDKNLEKKPHKIND